MPANNKQRIERLEEALRPLVKEVEEIRNGKHPVLHGSVDVAWQSMHSQVDELKKELNVLKLDLYQSMLLFMNIANCTIAAIQAKSEAEELMFLMKAAEDLKRLGMGDEDKQEVNNDQG